MVEVSQEWIRCCVCETEALLMRDQSVGILEEVVGVLKIERDGECMSRMYGQKQLEISVVPTP